MPSNRYSCCNGIRSRRIGRRSVSSSFPCPSNWYRCVMASGTGAWGGVLSVRASHAHPTGTVAVMASGPGAWGGVLCLRAAADLKDCSVFFSRQYETWHYLNSD
ncbi:hypothetical protein AVEN_194027-1 [Araneus ventricosus]|uniref:Uncharacterized protein n=1 Tax=Araneus ventricosus TaxID=182803 RepID=A0A4Y1ZWN0_ARAVE|nr:hypothetical protein AVEN_194027-1 [Araneus ventricosus]